MYIFKSSLNDNTELCHKWYNFLMGHHRTLKMILDKRDIFMYDVMKSDLKNTYNEFIKLFVDNWMFSMIVYK